MTGNGRHCFIYGAKVNVEGEGCKWAIGEQIKRLIPFWCSERTQRLNDVVFLTLETKMANWKDDSMTMGARSVLRSELDCLPDFFVAANDVQFRREFRTLTSEDSFCDVPSAVIERARSLLVVELVDTVAKTVHDTVEFDLGCSRVPLFSLETGTRQTLLQVQMRLPAVFGVP